MTTHITWKDFNFFSNTADLYVERDSFYSMIDKTSGLTVMIVFHNGIEGYDDCWRPASKKEIKLFKRKQLEYKLNRL